MRQGHFEPDPDSGDRPVYRLQWATEDQLDEQERNYAEFVRYLIAIGRLTELTEQVNQ
ncbi:MAG TPA: hypothetical protein VNL16_16165 [Chloroflexota bacterium]|nr:hypothetical protein [Chloroflexota bacterium]